MTDPSHPPAHSHGHARSANVDRFWALADILPSLALPERPRRAIDVGCGTGEDARWLAEAGFQAVGVDISADALAIAAERTPPGLDVQWIVGTASALPADDASCVLVTDRGCLHHVAPEDVPAYVAQVARVLVPGGAWVIHDLLGHGPQLAELDAERIHELARDSMLDVESYETIEAAHAMHGPHQVMRVVLRRR